MLKGPHTVSHGSYLLKLTLYFLNFQTHPKLLTHSSSIQAIKSNQNSTKKLFSLPISSFTGNSNEEASSAEPASIKEEPVDPIELRRLQQLTANGQFLNGNYQFQNGNNNGTTFTSLTPATVLHHQPHVPGMELEMF